MSQFNSNLKTNLPYDGVVTIPIGTILPFYDFGGLLTFDPTKFVYCIGQTINVGTIGLRTLPDGSNRYLVGFGSEAGGDNGSAAWNTTIKGTANHTFNLGHEHTYYYSYDHTHGYYFSYPHTHTSGGLWALIGSSYAQFQWNSSGGQFTYNNRVNCSSYQGGTATSAAYGTTMTGSTGSTSLGTDYRASGGSSNGTNTTSTTGGGLSSSFVIQPRSIQVRYIMRIK